MSNMARELPERTTQVVHCFQINNLQFVDQETVYHVHYALKNSPLPRHTRTMQVMGITLSTLQ